MIKHPYTYDQRIEFLAYECIRGTFGNKWRRVKALGDLYRPVQDRVNKILESGKDD